MKLVMDACSLINLDSGGAFSMVLNLPEFELNVGPLVVQECGELEALHDAVRAGSVRALDDSVLGANLFELLRRKYHLGLGETECIAFAVVLGMGVCTDDRRARDAVTMEIGATRLIGTIGLLKHCVALKVLTTAQAFAAYRKMITAGAFLPVMREQDFN